MSLQVTQLKQKAYLLDPCLSAIELASHYSSSKQQTNPQNLPRLPLPKLTDTLNKYLKTVRPLLTDGEFAVTAKIVKEFSEEHTGQKLQKILEKRAEERVNWLEEWWLNVAYLEFRHPLVVFSSAGHVFPFQRFKSQKEQLQHAAKTLSAMLEYKELVDTDQIATDMIGKNPMDMTQYKKLFGTCRVPAKGRDKISFNDSKYITVIHNNHIFHVDLWGEDDMILSEEQIVQQLQRIVDLSPAPEENAIGVLTSEYRETWAAAYDLLAKDSVNAASLVDVERSMAVLCLDEAVGLWRGDMYGIQPQAAGVTMHGAGAAVNGANRWFDKTVQFLVGADGVVGITYEHTPAEGQPIAVMADHVINYIKSNTKTNTSSTSPKEPKKLQFNVNEEVQGMIKAAKNNLDKLAKDLEMECFTFDTYGKNFIKKHNMSPDSYLQMAMQYAFYRVHKLPGAHYESAATRMYCGGRTETIRSCSSESMTFARAMLDHARTPLDRMAAMRAAVYAHKDYALEALLGFGVDRHLLGLKLAALEAGEPEPPLFTDAGYRKSMHMRLSTSQVACNNGFMCFGPLVSDGYAICYNPRDDHVTFAVSAFKHNASSDLSAFRAALENALLEMRDLLVDNPPSNF